MLLSSGNTGDAGAAGVGECGNYRRVAVTRALVISVNRGCSVVLQLHLMGYNKDRLPPTDRRKYSWSTVTKWRPANFPTIRRPDITGYQSTRHTVKSSHGHLVTRLTRHRSTRHTCVSISSHSQLVKWAHNKATSCQTGSTQLKQCSTLKL